MALIDFVAIAPFYLTFMIADARILRILRFLRVLKMTKHFHHSNTFNIITNTIFKKRSELFSSLILMFCLLMICATGVFFAENETQPDKFSSIPSAMVVGGCHFDNSWLWRHFSRNLYRKNFRFNISNIWHWLFCLTGRFTCFRFF